MLAHTPSLLRIKRTDEPRGLKMQAFEDQPFSQATWIALLQSEKNYNQGHDPARILPGHRYHYRIENRRERMSQKMPGYEYGASGRMPLFYAAGNAFD